MSFQVRISPSAVSDTIGQDTIVINIKSGAYYSLTETGSKIWADVQNGEVSSEALGAVSVFVKEGLLEVDGALRESIDSILPISDLFEKYTDMESLLLADPIHEVDEQGWPKLK
jgi:hypothetical protein